MTHPHNANPESYALALRATFALLMESQKASDYATYLCLETIEASDARREAIAVHQKAQAVRDAVESLLLACRTAQNNAEHRTRQLVEIEYNAKN